VKKTLAVAAATFFVSACGSGGVDGDASPQLSSVAKLGE
jgi:hypothetical protein